MQQTIQDNKVLYKHYMLLHLFECFQIYYISYCNLELRAAWIINFSQLLSYGLCIAIA